MAWIALTCPQCSAPLPRIALWRSVKCTACGSLITRTESIVERDTFRKALIRARNQVRNPGTSIRCGANEYQLLQRLGTGGDSEIHLVRRVAVYPHLATLKLAHSKSAATRYTEEAASLRQIHGSLSGPASLYGYRNLPSVIADGPVDGGKHALILDHPHGFWGSLAGLARRFPSGIDPRHAVWIWRRMLDTLHFIHSLGWAHGDIRPEHALVHPRDHGVRLIGWSSAIRNPGKREQSEDIRKSALVILVLLGGTGDEVPGSVPTELAELIEKTIHDDSFRKSEGARGIDLHLRAASQAAFGPPSFVHLHL